MENVNLLYRFVKSENHLLNEIESKTKRFLHQEKTIIDNLAKNFKMMVNDWQAGIQEPYQEGGGKQCLTCSNYHYLSIKRTVTTYY